MSPPSAGEAIIFYDGVCGLCNRLNQFVLARDSSAQFRFAALQSRFARETLARYGRNSEDLDTLYLLEDYGLPSERLRAKSDAALRVLDRMGGVWKLSRDDRLASEILTRPRLRSHRENSLSTLR